MSLKQLVIVSILGCSSFAFADKPADQDRSWTILASQNHEHAKDSKTVTDPGVLVTSQRDPKDKK